MKNERTVILTETDWLNHQAMLQMYAKENLRLRGALTHTMAYMECESDDEQERLDFQSARAALRGGAE